MNDVAVMGVALGILGIIIIPIIIVAIILIVANFSLYKKAGKEGWKCLIPYYNTWTECEFLGLNTNWVWILLGLSFVGGLLDGILDTSIFSFVSYAANLYFSVLRSISMAQSFGKDTGFGIGILLLPVIFVPMLAFGKDEYVGARPMNDFIFKNENPTTPATNLAPQTGLAAENEISNATSNAQPAQSTAQAERFCTGCGAKLEDEAKFCTSCGKQVN